MVQSTCTIGLLFSVQTHMYAKHNLGWRDDDTLKHCLGIFFVGSLLGQLYCPIYRPFSYLQYLNFFSGISVRYIRENKRNIGQKIKSFCIVWCSKSRPLNFGDISCVPHTTELRFRGHHMRGFESPHTLKTCRKNLPLRLVNA